MASALDPALAAEVTTERQVIDIFLQPGDLYFGDADTRIRTVLGSCVAITLWHPRARLGGMCHFLLPQRGGPSAGLAPDGRYGDEAVALLVDEIRRQRTAPGDYVAKVFGGGDMFPALTCGRGGHVGRRNGEFALARLAELGVRVRNCHLAGTGHRQVIFEVWSGDVWLRHGELI